MFWLGLASVIDAPGYLRASVPFGWASLSALLPFMLWREGELNLLHWCGLAFLSYAFVSIAWTPFWQDGVWAFWQWALLGMAFWLGSTLPSTQSIFLGAALGIWVSSAFAILQFSGLDPFLVRADGDASGWFFNPMISGEYATIVILGLVVHREWVWILGVLPSLFLSHSRGAWLALAIGLIAFYSRSWLLIGLTCLVSFFGVRYFYPSQDILRLHIWDVASHSLYPFGWGAGSFINVLFPNTHPEYVHNDYLQLAWEFGFGAIPVYFIFLICALQRRSLEWPILASGLLMACFSFPLYAPVSAFVLALCAGRISRDWADARSRAVEWRPYQLSWGYGWERIESGVGKENLPVQLGTAK